MTVKKLDVVTQVCPFPLIEAKAAMAELASGDQLVIEFDCTQATEAIPQWAAEEALFFIWQRKKLQSLTFAQRQAGALKQYKLTMLLTGILWLIWVVVLVAR